MRWQPQNLAALLPFLPEDAQAPLRDLQNQVATLDEGKARDFAVGELRKFERSLHRSYLPDVHTDWLLIKLKEESSQILSVILRFLPADRVKAILQALPNDILARLPKMSESYAIAPGLAEFIKRRFERHFEVDRIYDPKQPFAYADLVHLKPALLKKLFQELGYREMALGLKLLPGKTQDLVMGKLPPSDRLHVEKHMLQNAVGTSEARHKKAQVHLISQESGQMASFVQEIGFLVFAKTVLPENQNDLPVLCHKLSFAESQRLLKVVEAHLNQNSPASVLAYREELLQVCKTL